MRKANRKGQRILAAALCVGMLAGMVPAQAFADDTQPTAVVEQAVTEETPPAADETTDADADTTGDEDQNPEQGSEDNTQPTEEKNDEDAGDSSDEQTQAVTHIATTVKQVPTGIEWDTSVTADTFAEPYATVKAKAANGTEYTVEVIPADTVYFIDSVAATGNAAMDSVQSTPAYAAAKALLGDKLLNVKSDQFYEGDASWGLVNKDAKTKGYTDTSDKTATGVYGKDATGAKQA